MTSYTDRQKNEEMDVIKSSIQNHLKIAVEVLEEKMEGLVEISPNEEAAYQWLSDTISENPYTSFMKYGEWVEEKKPYDPINNPEHYVGEDGIEIFDFLNSNNVSWPVGNIIKYVFRHKKKNGKEDLEKAQFYLDKLIGDDNG